MKKTTYEVHSLTGSVLIDGDGRQCGNESAGVISRHRTLAAAQRKAASMRHPMRPAVEVRKVVADDENGE
jgi:hypothetical protein